MRSSGQPSDDSTARSNPATPKSPGRRVAAIARSRPARLGVAVALSCACLAGLAQSAAAQESAPDSVSADGVRHYWTADRMREATPLEIGSDASSAAGATSSATPLRAAGDYTRSTVDDPSAEGVRAQGKVFMTISSGADAGDYVCSGTALDSANGSVVFTAGHCVFDTAGSGYVDNFLFVPAYDDGQAPFGEWPAVSLLSPDPYTASADYTYDYSAVKVDTNAEGQTLNEVVGGRGIAFNQSRSRNYTSYGYPAQQPPLEFTGEQEFRCDSSWGGNDDAGGSGADTMWIGCDMTGGSSGGGWISGGKLYSVNVYSYCDITGTVCEERLYGPYLDETASDLFDAISGGTASCGGKKVTILGTSEADSLKGTNGKDVIAALAGDDTIAGRGGKDRICANDGSDRISGGTGKDRCDGGPGRDKATSCEVRKRIP